MADCYSIYFFCLFLFERAIFQIFLKTYCCTKSLFFELETSNFGYLLIFWFPLKVRQSQKQIGHIHNGWYSTKIIWMVQNQFGPKEGQDISLKNKGHYPHYLVRIWNRSNRNCTNGASQSLIQIVLWQLFLHISCVQFWFNYTLFPFKRYYFWVWPFYDHFWSFFCQLHEYLPQKLGTKGDFEVFILTGSKATT